jgi:hypothetical protein
MLFVSAILIFSLLVPTLANLRHASNNNYTVLDHLTPLHSDHSKLAYRYASSQPAPMTSHRASRSPEVSVNRGPPTKPSKALTSAALRTLAKHTVLHVTQLHKEYNEAHQAANLSHQVAQEHLKQREEQIEEWKNTPAAQRGPEKPFRKVPVSKEAINWFRSTSLGPERNEIQYYAKYGSTEEWEKERAAFIQNSYNHAVLDQRKNALLDPDGPVGLLAKLRRVGMHPH